MIPPSQLTDEQLRIEVAELCGWTDELPNTGGLLLPYRWVNKTTNTKTLDLPNYPHDLNACAEFEYSMTHQQQGNYAEAIMDLPNIGITQFQCIAATARQRCIAFIQTMRKEPSV